MQIIFQKFLRFKIFKQMKHHNAFKSDNGRNNFIRKLFRQ